MEPSACLEEQYMFVDRGFKNKSGYGPQFSAFISKLVVALKLLSSLLNDDGSVSFIAPTQLVGAQRLLDAVKSCKRSLLIKNTVRFTN